MTRPPLRTILVAVGVVVAVGLVAGAGWFWIASQQRRSLTVYADAMTRAQASQGPEVSPELKAAAIRDLEAALQEYPSAADAPRAAYQLGNLKYSIQQYSPARASYEIALVKGGTDTVRTLAEAGIGYTWEAEKNYGKAAQTYEAALARLKPAEFMHEELLLDLARVQELAGRKDDAVRTYRRVLENPKARRTDEVKTKLARMGIAP